MQVEPTARLYYRLLDNSDAELFFQLDQDPAVMQYINGGKPNSMEFIQQVFLPRMNAYRDASKGYGLYGAFSHTPQQLRDGSNLAAHSFLGWVLARPMHFFTTGAQAHDLELGWRFFQSTWRQGYALEAAQAVAKKLATLPEVTHLSAIALPDNQASIALMQKLGMQFVRRYLHQEPLGDFDVVHYRKTL